MAKNNKLINSLNEIARRNRSQNVATAADQMVPQIYAAIAIALHRTYGFGYKRINDVFVESQHIWESYGLSTLFQTNFFRLFFRYCTGV